MTSGLSAIRAESGLFVCSFSLMVSILTRGTRSGVSQMLYSCRLAFRGVSMEATKESIFAMKKMVEER